MTSRPTYRHVSQIRINANSKHKTGDSAEEKMTCNKNTVNSPQSELHVIDAAVSSVAEIREDNTILKNGGIRAGWQGHAIKLQS